MIRIFLMSYILLWNKNLPICQTSVTVKHQNYLFGSGTEMDCASSKSRVSGPDMIYNSSENSRSHQMLHIYISDILVFEIIMSFSIFAVAIIG